MIFRFFGDFIIQHYHISSSNQSSLVLCRVQETKLRTSGSLRFQRMGYGSLCWFLKTGSRLKSPDAFDALPLYFQASSECIGEMIENKSNLVWSRYQPIKTIDPPTYRSRGISQSRYQTQTVNLSIYWYCNISTYQFTVISTNKSIYIYNIDLSTSQSTLGTSIGSQRFPLQSSRLCGGAIVVIIVGIDIISPTIFPAMWNWPRQCLGCNTWQLAARHYNTRTQTLDYHNILISTSSESSHIVHFDLTTRRKRKKPLEAAADGVWEPRIVIDSARVDLSMTPTYNTTAHLNLNLN